jgi:hypothetical protein
MHIRLSTFELRTPLGTVDTIGAAYTIDISAHCTNRSFRTASTIGTIILPLLFVTAGY